MGIDKTIEMINAVTDLVIQAVVIKSGGLNLDRLKQLPGIICDIFTICRDAKSLLPEIADLDEDEISRLGLLLFANFKKIIAAVAA